MAASKAATASDASYLSAGAVPYGPGHNLAVGIIAASMAGMSAAASEFGTRIRCTFADAPDRPDGPGGSEAWSLPLTASLRLGLWAHVLEEAEGSGAPPYPRDWPYAEVAALKAIIPVQTVLHFLLACIAHLPDSIAKEPHCLLWVLPSRALGCEDFYAAA